MSEKSKKLDNRIIAAFIIFAVYVVLNLFFPRSGDDWAWGSKIGIDRLNSFFADYTALCRYELRGRIPARSRVITSDDVFDFMMNLRALNQGVDRNREELMDEYLALNDASKPLFQLKHLAFFLPHH